MTYQMALIILSVFIASSVHATGNKITLDYDFQRPGGDYTNSIEKDERGCAEKCEKSSRCQAFDFHKSDNSCWLKDSANSSVPYQGVVSGFKNSRPSHETADMAASMDLNYDTQRPGRDYSSFYAEDVQQCSLKCEQSSQCEAFDYTISDSYCYLKSSKPAARKYKGIISGVKKLYSFQLKSIQKVLTQKNYDPGVVDGLMGKKTEKALRMYQKDNNLPVTGRVDEATLAGLGMSQQDASLATTNVKKQERAITTPQGNDEDAPQKTSQKSSDEIKDNPPSNTASKGPHKEGNGQQQSVVTQGGQVMQGIGNAFTQVGEENEDSFVGWGFGLAGKVYTSVGDNIVAIDQGEKSVGKAGQDIHQDVLDPEQDSTEQKHDMAQ